MKSPIQRTTTGHQRCLCSEDEDRMTPRRSEPTTQQLELLRQTIRDVVRFHRLSADDAQDFAQSVQLRVLERQYDLFSRYNGRSSLRTYLTVAVKRMLLDWRNAKYGKWRPSAAAARLGDHAVTLERLIRRDGYTADEAVRLVAMVPGAPTAAVLRRLAEELPVRPRGRIESASVLCEVAVVDFDDPVEAQERDEMDRRMRQGLSRALNALPAEDRWLLAERYNANRRVHALAEILGVHPKALYRRFDHLLRVLRRALERD
jgi:RNA polymerase sigma factor (sigma-70 family)